MMGELFLATPDLGLVGFAVTVGLCSEPGEARIPQGEALARDWA